MKKHWKMALLFLCACMITGCGEGNTPSESASSLDVNTVHESSETPEAASDSSDSDSVDSNSSEIASSEEVTSSESSPAEPESSEVAKETLSAEFVISYISDLTEKYDSSHSRDYIHAAILVANYDSLDAEELEKCLTHYGLSRDTLKDAFDKCDGLLRESYTSTLISSQFSTENTLPFTDEPRLDDLIIDPLEKEKAKELYDALLDVIEIGKSDNIESKINSYWETDHDSLSQEERTFVNLAYTFLINKSEYPFEILPNHD